MRILIWGSLFAFYRRKLVYPTSCLFSCIFLPYWHHVFILSKPTKTVIQAVIKIWSGTNREVVCLRRNHVVLIVYQSKIKRKMNFLHVSRFKTDQILESSATASACFKNHVGCTIQPWWYARTVTKFDLEHIERLCTSVETTCSQNVLSEQNQEKMNIYTSDVKAGLLKYKGSCWTHLFWWTVLPFFGYWIY